jgi:hypothetical protein
MEWTHLLAGLLGWFVGDFLRAVWQNERKRRADNLYRQMWADAATVARHFPPAKAEPPEVK